MIEWLSDEISKASDDTLYEWMANAIATTACIGHTKGHMNEGRARAYREALIERGHEVPEIDFWKCLDDPNSYRDELHKLGTYGGAGSF